MGSSEELDPFAPLSRLGDLTQKESKAFGFSLTIKYPLIKLIRIFYELSRGGDGLLYPLPKFLIPIVTESPIE
jgi:hypothetical protein